MIEEFAASMAYGIAHFIENPVKPMWLFFASIIIVKRAIYRFEEGEVKEK